MQLKQAILKYYMLVLVFLPQTLHPEPTKFYYPKLALGQRTRNIIWQSSAACLSCVSRLPMPLFASPQGWG